MSMAYLVSSVASATATTAQIFTETRDTFSPITSLSFIITMGSTALIALAIRRQPVWIAVFAAHVAMIIGAATVLFDAGLIPNQLSLSLVLIGEQVVAAALLVVAWRARSTVTALLAGVFVLSRVLDDLVLIELLSRTGLAGLTPLIVVTLVLLCVGVAAAEVIRIGESGQAAAEERSLDKSVLIGGTLAVTGLATLAAQVGPDRFSDGSTGPALLACIAGFVIMGATHQNRKTTAPTVHIEPALLVMCGGVTALTTWVEFGPRFLFAGSTNAIANNIAVGFENDVGWSRFVSLVLLLTTVPIVMLVAQSGRRSLSAGAAAVAASGLIWVFFVLDDLELGLVNFVLIEALTDWGAVIVLGGTIAFALRSTEGASIEAGIVVLLAGLPLLESLARQLPCDIVGDDLISSGFEHIGDVRLFTLVTVIGLVWIAFWWALRPNKPLRELDDGEGELAFAIQQ